MVTAISALARGRSAFLQFVFLPEALAPACAQYIFQQSSARVPYQYLETRSEFCRLISSDFDCYTLLSSCITDLLTSHFSRLPPKSNIPWCHDDIRFEPQAGAALICAVSRGRASREVRNCDSSFRVEEAQYALCGWTTKRNEFRFGLY